VKKSYTKKGGIVMGKTVEYPAEFKLKAVQTYLEGNHGRI
jgi:transposase-like protein